MIFKSRLSVSRFLNLAKVGTNSFLELDFIDLFPNQSTLSKLLYLANFHLKVKHLISLCLVFIIGLAFVDFKYWPIFILATILGCVFVTLYFAKLSVSNFRKQFPFFLLTLKSLLKSGVDCVQAVSVALENIDRSSLLFREFNNFVSNIKKYDFKTAIFYLGDCMNVQLRFFNFRLQLISPDNGIILLKNALHISSQEGASLSNFIERVVRYCRLSEQFSQKVNSVTITQQISGVGIAVLAFTPLLFKFFKNRSEFYDLVSDPIGSKLISFSALLIVAGLISLFIICNRKI